MAHENEVCVTVFFDEGLTDADIKKLGDTISQRNEVSRIHYTSADEAWENYNQAFHFPGGHTPTEQEVKTWYAPLAQKMMMEFSAKEERYFQHFKGGKYRFIHSAFDSETQERMVVYQALYGDQAYWVRPEDMFFGKVTRDGRTFNRFTEIDR